MKKIILFLLLIASIFSSCNKHIQKNNNINDTEKLELLCKVWGLIKYYHPYISQHQINWDSALIANIEKVYEANNKQELNTILMQLIPPINVNNTSDIVVKNPFVLNYNISFLTDTLLLSHNVAEKLQQLVALKASFENKYISPSKYAENPNLESDTNFNALQSHKKEIRLLALFRLWNIINYYYPYKYLLDDDWNKILSEYIPKFINADNNMNYHLIVRKFASKINDNHVFVTSQTISNYLGKYFLPIELKTVENQVIVSQLLSDSLASISNLKVGDLILEINGKNLQTIRDSLKEILSGSNEIAIIDKINLYLGRTADSSISLVINRCDTIMRIVSKTYSRQLFKELSNKEKKQSYTKKVDNNIVYFNLKDINYYEIDSVFKTIIKSKVIIFDLRNNCKFVIHDLSNWILEKECVFYSSLTPSYSHPGLFEIKREGKTGPPIQNNNYFKGSIIVLINENTQSIGEFTTMALMMNPKTTLIGKTTAGADGNVSIAYLPGQIKVYFSGLGIYSPSFKQTQRIGIRPNIIKTPTIAGVRNSEDEVLNYAINYAMQIN